MSTNRIGYYMRGSKYRKGLYSHMLFFNINTPIAENYNQMGRLLHIEEFSSQNAIGLDRIEPIVHKPYIVVNPNASDLRLERRWPIENYIALIDKLLSKFEGDFYIIGSPGEAEYSNQIKEYFIDNPRVINLAGKTSINELLAYIKGCRMAITNDSGPLHLALYYKKDTIALFGPCHPDHYGLKRDNVYIHYLPVYCSPCVHEFEQAPCNGNNVCMQMISVQSVVQSFVELLDGKPFVQASSETIFTYSHVLGRIDRV